MKRYVNISKDKQGRFISDEDWPSRADAKTFPIFDREHVIETVRLLSEQEEKEIASKLSRLDAIEKWVEEKIKSSIPYHGTAPFSDIPLLTELQQIIKGEK